MTSEMGNAFYRMAGLSFGIQWACFPIAYWLKTERFYDLAGAATHLSVAWYATRLFPPRHSRAWIQVGLVAAWTLRLGAYLSYRGLRHGDRRFDRIKTNPGSFLVAWTLQGVWVMANLAPTLVALSNRVGSMRLKPVELAGWSLFAVGFLIETVADQQKMAFKADPDNAGRFITSGLWSLSRHPNYFGEICLWSGLALAASASFTRPAHWFSLVGTVFNASLILFVSGVPMLEKLARRRWGSDPQYKRYAEETPLLVPFVNFPKYK